MRYQRSFKRISSFAALTVAVIAALPSVASARPIETWSYVTDTNFTAATFNSGGGGSTKFDPDELSWGSGAPTADFQVNTGNADTNRSALTIGNGRNGVRTGGGPVTGSVNTTIGGVPSGAQVGIGTSFTHWNNPISANFNTLSGGTITDTLTLKPLLPSEYVFPGALPVNAPTLTFQFKFLETPNAGTNGVCEDGQPVPGGGCEDLFGFNATTLNQAFTYTDSGVDNIFGNGDDFNRTYFASIFILNTGGGAFPIQQLVAGECRALGLNVGCFGFRTNEAAQTTAIFAFAVTTQPISIPEPGSLALAGLALVGMAARMRRRRFD